MAYDCAESEDDFGEKKDARSLASPSSRMILWEFHRLIIRTLNPQHEFMAINLNATQWKAVAAAIEEIVR